MAGLAPSFEVPAEYFYALGCTMPTAIDAATRLTIAGSKSEAALVGLFQQAIDDGTIDKKKLTITPLQAARRIIALAGTKGVDPPCKIGPAGDATKLVTAWLASTDKTDQLWSGLLTTGTAAFQAANRRGQLRLVLCALFEFDDVPPDQVLSDLVKAVQKPLGSPAGSTGLGVTDADGLAAVTADVWKVFLTANASTFLPAFTSPPGATVSVPDRIRAFLRRLQHFYSTGLITPDPPTLTPGSAPQLDRYGFDPLQAFLAEYHNGTGAAFVFGTNVPDDAAARAAIAAVFPAEADAAAWLAAAVKCVGELAAVTAGLIPAAAANAASLEFSIIEALYTRGFTGKDAITALDKPDFEAAVAGSVAHQWADAIWAKAGGTVTPPGGSPGP